MGTFRSEVESRSQLDAPLLANLILDLASQGEIRQPGYCRENTTFHSCKRPKLTLTGSVPGRGIDLFSDYYYHEMVGSDLSCHKSVGSDLTDHELVGSERS